MKLVVNLVVYGSKIIQMNFYNFDTFLPLTHFSPQLKSIFPSKCLIFSRWVTLSHIYWLTSQFIDLIINHHLFLTLIFHRYLFSSSSEAAKVEVTHKPLDPSDNSKEQPNQSTRCTTILVRKLVIGLIIVIGIAVSWVSLTQFIKETYSPTFNGPFFTIWFTTTWMMLCYPVHIAGTMVIFGDKRKGGVKKLYE